MQKEAKTVAPHLHKLAGRVTNSFYSTGGTCFNNFFNALSAVRASRRNATACLLCQPCVDAPGRFAGGLQPSLEDRQKPYAKMGSILKSLDRDIVFNLCQYGQGEVWKWGSDVGGQCWRTTGDLGLAADKGLPGFYSIGLGTTTPITS